jgi:N-acyl-D-amino-acid deacylase
VAPPLKAIALLAAIGAYTSAAAATLIVNARIADGSGAPARAGAVRIEGERIVAVGQLEVAAGDRVIDAKGLVLAPGFIDTHSHYVDSSGVGENYLPRLPDALTAVSQGITTAIVGVDGSSSLPLAASFAQLDQVHTAINVGSYVGHGTIRLRVMGDDYRRTATGQELEIMRTFVARAMEEGALGLSTGLEYDPGIYSSAEEVVALAEESARHGGRYMSHIRSEDRDLWAAIDEVIEIGRRTRRPVHISHMKLGMKAVWGQDERFIAQLEKARAAGIEITGDVYPYDFWQTTLLAMFPERDLTSVAARASLDEVVAAEGIRLTEYTPEPALVGKTLAEIAAERKEDPALTLTHLTIAAEKPDQDNSATMAGMSQQDVDALLLWPHANVCSDGSLVGSHPRGAGTFAKIFRYYVRERGLLTVEQAVRKTTSLAAAHVGLRDRGLVQPGYFADLVLFDPATIADRATAREPRLLSVGVAKVWVNGGLVYDEGRSTGTRTGKVLRRQ